MELVVQLAAKLIPAFVGFPVFILAIALAIIGTWQKIFWLPALAALHGIDQMIFRVARIAYDGAVVRVATELSLPLGFYLRGAVTARTLEALAVGDRVLVRHGIATRAPVARLILHV